MIQIIFRKLFKERKKQILSKNGKIKRTRYCTCSLEFPTLITWTFNSVLNFIFFLCITVSLRAGEAAIKDSNSGWKRYLHVHVTCFYCYYVFVLSPWVSTPKASERTLFIRIPFFLYLLIPAKPIDLLAQYVGSDDNDLEIQMHEPYTILVVRTFRIQCMLY